MRNAIFLSALALALGAALLGCSRADGRERRPGSARRESGDRLEPSPLELPSASMGRLQLLLTDAPIEGVTAVNICFDRVDVTFADGDEAPSVTVLSSPGTYDLLSLQNGVTASLGIAELPEGFIQQIRVLICEAGSSIVVDGVEHPPHNT